VIMGSLHHCKPGVAGCEDCCLMHECCNGHCGISFMASTISEGSGGAGFEGLSKQQSSAMLHTCYHYILKSCRSTRQ
jgi:hypothetical protein